MGRGSGPGSATAPHLPSHWGSRWRVAVGAGVGVAVGVGLGLADAAGATVKIHCSRSMSLSWAETVVDLTM